MKELVIASDNKGKIREITALLDDVQLLSLKDIGFTDVIAEPYHTFEENALAKASAIYEFCGKNVFADDSGLCVLALGGEPGVDSAHYSGTRDDVQNLNKVLAELEGQTDRSAYYKAVICLIWDGETYFFEGRCDGEITQAPEGNDGFGYDPIFKPNGFEETFGDIPLNIKNTISHRGKAIAKMIAFLQQQDV
jgi:XTP/dITP diphosphohydrolase